MPLGQELPQILGALSSLRGGSNAFAQRWQELEAQAQQQKQQADQQARLTAQDDRAQQALMLQAEGARRTQETHALGQGERVAKFLDDPSVMSEEDAMMRATFMRNMAPQIGVDPGFVEFKARQVLASLPKRRKEALYQRVTKGLSPDEITQLRAQTKTFRPDDSGPGEEFTFAQLEQDVRGLPSGVAITRSTPPSLMPNTPEERIAAALQRGDMETVRLEEEALRRVDAQRRDPPRPSTADPEIAELRKDLLRLQVERAGDAKEPNQAQFTAATYAGRMEQAEKTFSDVQATITAMSLPKFELQTNSWFARPTFQSPEVQSYMQAARNFINSVLRRESGAVIAPSEFAEAKQQYLPQPGDTPEALAQKAANRRYVFDSMKRASGNAYQPPPDVVPPLTSDAQVGKVYMHSGKKVRVREKTRTGFLFDEVVE